MVRRELLSTLRGWRAFLLLLLFSGVTGAYVITAWPESLSDVTNISGINAASDVSRVIARNFSFGLLGAALLFVPAYAAGAIVVERGATVGIFTDRDILNKLADSFAARAHLPVRDFMTPDPETLEHDVPIAFGLNRMMVGGCRHIPILCEGRLAGMVSVRNVLSFLVERLGETQKADALA